MAPAMASLCGPLPQCGHDRGVCAAVVLRLGSDGGEDDWGKRDGYDLAHGATPRQTEGRAHSLPAPSRVPP